MVYESGIEILQNKVSESVGLPHFRNLQYMTTHSSTNRIQAGISSMVPGVSPKLRKFCHRETVFEHLQNSKVPDYHGELAGEDVSIRRSTSAIFLNFSLLKRRNPPSANCSTRTTERNASPTFSPTFSCLGVASRGGTNPGWCSVRFREANGWCWEGIWTGGGDTVLGEGEGDGEEAGEGAVGP